MRSIFGWKTWVVTALLATPAASVGQQEEFAESGQSETVPTQDGVLLGLTYWKPLGVEKDWDERDNPVVVLMNHQAGAQSDYLPLAEELVGDGMAVITFDFRGQGRSTQVDTSTYRQFHPRYDGDEELDIATDFRRPNEWDEMIYDLEAIKTFVLNQNNASALNVRRMGIVAAGDLACHVAMRWINDLEFSSANEGFVRQGKDLSALVLLSPDWSKALSDVGSESEDLPILILYSMAQRRDGERVARKLKVAVQGDRRSTNSSYFREDSVAIPVELEERRRPITLEALMSPAMDENRGLIRGFLIGRLDDDGLLWESRDANIVRTPPSRR